MIFVYVILIIVFIIFGLSVFLGAPYVPSHRKNINQAFSELYPLNKKDTLVDIGSGDGIVLREAAKKGANAVGFEINPFLVIISRLISKKEKHVKIIFGDYQTSHLPHETTVVYLFSATLYLNKIKKLIQAETNTLGRPINLIVYGNRINGVRPVKSIGAHHLYVFYPLQTNKAQV